MTRITAAAITALLSMSAAQAQDGPYMREPAARTCIQKRLTELVAEKRANIAADTQLTARTSDLKAELKTKGRVIARRSAISLGSLRMRTISRMA
jgi:hypothetical protein